MNKRIPVSIALAITIIAMTVTFSITWIVSMNIFDNTVSAVTSLQAQYAKIREIDVYVRNNFMGEIDDDALFDRVALGYVNGLGDKYSAYYTEREYTEMQQIESGDLVGIGIEVIRDADGWFRIVKVHDGSPAATAGVTAGGRIASVDGEDAKNITTVKSLRSRLYGGVGTELALSVLYDMSETRDYNIRRSAYQKPLVESQDLVSPDNVAYTYIRISSFASDPFAELNYAVNQAVANGAKGLIFDLRGTSDGLFRNTYQSIDYLCPVGTVAKSQGRTGTTRVLATSDENEVPLPMVVLVDGTTAGPAELFAASVRDLAGGQILGTKTAGHGTMQSTPYRLSDGSAVSVTTAQLLTGRDEDFNGVGLTPNVEVEGNMAERYPGGGMEEYLHNPLPKEDEQIARARELLRSMVREAGGEPGESTYNTSTVVAGAEEGEDARLAGDSSLDTSNASGTSGAEDEGASASASEVASGSSSSSSSSR